MTRTIVNFKCKVPTPEELTAARALYKSVEPRALFYRAAVELVELVWRDQSSLSLAEATAVLLQSWNKDFYRFHRFDEEHFSNLDTLLKMFHESFSGYRLRDISGLTDQDEVPVKEVFTAFENLLGPVGAAKCIHLQAPRFFPLWDREIAAGYKLALGRMGENANRYWLFMGITREQIRRLGRSLTEDNPLKILDEYNYCVHTKRRQLPWTSGRTDKECM